MLPSITSSHSPAVKVRVLRVAGGEGVGIRRVLYRKRCVAVVCSQPVEDVCKVFKVTLACNVRTVANGTVSGPRGRINKSVQCRLSETGPLH